MHVDVLIFKFHEKHQFPELVSPLRFYFHSVSLNCLSFLPAWEPTSVKLLCLLSSPHDLLASSVPSYFTGFNWDSPLQLTLQGCCPSLCSSLRYIDAYHFQPSEGCSVHSLCMFHRFVLTSVPKFKNQISVQIQSVIHVNYHFNFMYNHYI